MPDQLTYAGSGIDIDQTDAAKREMGKILESQDPRVMNRVGAFASLFEASFPGIAHPVLVMKTEEPGSKQQLAFAAGRIEGICFDLINHLVNDCIVMGATPLMVQDAVITGAIEKDVITALVAGMAKACRLNECSLVGGETSIQPGVLGRGAYVLTSSIVGVVDRDRIIDGARIAPGDVVVALASSGLHTNGYTLVRKLMEKDPAVREAPVGGVPFREAVLEPHRAYYPVVKGLFADADLTGMAHITGGGIQDNLNRILPPGVDALVDLSRIETLPVFSLIRARGGVADDEMLRTFNCGVGLCLVARPAAAERLARAVEEKGCRAYAIGRIVEGGSRRVRFEGKLRWTEPR
jgi:phosphoribosylformylglycinamidine cyclo-ligase